MLTLACCPAPAGRREEPDMDTQKLDVLLRAIELGSFSAAAEELGFTPSGVSHMAAAVENELGYPILVRGRSGISLTKDGKDILPQLIALSQAEKNVEQKASNVRGLAKGKLIIGVYSSFSTQCLPQILKKYHKRYPQISIQLMEGVHAELDEWMASTNMDFCIYSYQKGSALEWYPLFDDPMYVVVPKGHPLASRQSVRPKEIEKEPFIMPGRYNDMDVVGLLRRFRVRPDIRFMTIENYSALAMIEQGLGISVMNELITHQLRSDVVLLPFDPPQAITIGVAVPSLRNASPAARRIIEMLRKEYPYPGK